MKPSHWLRFFWRPVWYIGWIVSYLVLILLFDFTTAFEEQSWAKIIFLVISSGVFALQGGRLYIWIRDYRRWVRQCKTQSQRGGYYPP